MSKVLVTVTGLAAPTAGGTPDQIKLTTTGELTPIENGWRLDYQESQPDGSSAEDITVELTPDQVTMNRKGMFCASMVFIKDKRFEGRYNTPYGPIALAVFATRVKVDADEARGRVHLKYQLELQGMVNSSNELILEYRKCLKQN